jgi:hypothetical protein
VSTTLLLLHYYLALTSDDMQDFDGENVDGDKYLESVGLKSFLGTDDFSEITVMTELAEYLLTEVIFFYDTVT